MSKRSEHTFGFKAGEIAAAAQSEAVYHLSREAWWRKEQDDAAATVLEVAGVKLHRHVVTGGERIEVSVDFGERGAFAHRRMQPSFEKAEGHRLKAERFATDAEVYGSQHPEKLYDLDTDDVHHFRLGGQERED